MVLFVVSVALKGATTFVLFEQQLFLHDKMTTFSMFRYFSSSMAEYVQAGLWRGEGWIETD
jgi:hypothetical protein